MGTSLYRVLGRREGPFRLNDCKDQMEIRLNIVKHMLSRDSFDKIQHLIFIFGVCTSQKNKNVEIETEIFANLNLLSRSTW